MSRKKARLQKPKPSQQTEKQRPIPAPDTRPVKIGPCFSGWRKWAWRFALAVFAPVFLLGLTETGLRLFGFGYPVTFFIRNETREICSTNEKFAWRFFSRASATQPFLANVPARKPSGTIRICILGESAAMGTPDPAFNFGRILEVMLRRRYPDKKFEIINAAMRGINSYIVLPIAQECATMSVDLFIIYMGNNEVIGLHGPDPDSSRWEQSLTLIRASHWFKSTRLGQALYSVLASRQRARDASPSERQDMDYFRRHRLPADDWRRDLVNRNFQANLRDICRTITQARSKALLSSVAVNLKDCPPLGSLHRPRLTAEEKSRWEGLFNQGIQSETRASYQEAIQSYLSAAQIDDHYADLHFRLGRCYLQLGMASKARNQFQLACDWDALQFRTDTRLNGIIRNVAAEFQPAGVTLVEAERAFAESELSDHGIPGERLFYEHVHPTFAGNYLLARTCYSQLISVLEEALGKAPATTGLPAPQECADALAYTNYDDINVVGAITRLTAGAPFLDQIEHAQRQAAAEASLKKRLDAFNMQEAERCLKTYFTALSQQPEYWKLRFNLASFQQELKQYPAAIEQFQWLVTAYPKAKALRLALGNVLTEAGRPGDALTQYQAALELDPADADLRRSIQKINGHH